MAIDFVILTMGVYVIGCVFVVALHHFKINTLHSTVKKILDELEREEDDDPQP